MVQNEVKNNPIESRTVPKVSIIIPTYNAAQFIGEAIGSILNQSLQDFEIIIWDSASTDSIESAAKISTDKRIKFESLPFLCPSAIKRNLGIHQSNSKYIAMMDADDIMHKDRLKYQVDFLEENRDIDIVGSNFIVFGQSGTRPRIQPKNDAQIKAKLLLINGNAIHNPTILTRRRFIDERSLYFPNIKTDEDHALWINCLKAGARFHNIQKPLLHYRKHGKSYTAQNSQEYNQGKMILRLDLIQAFFKNLTYSECLSLAELITNPKGRSVENLELALASVRKVYAFEECEFEADLGLIKRIIGDSYTKARKFSIDS